jgi:hypothetical protein
MSVKNSLYDLFYCILISNNEIKLLQYYYWLFYSYDFLSFIYTFCEII